MGFYSDNRFASLQFITLRDHVVECRENRAQETRETSCLHFPLVNYFPIQQEESGSQSQGPVFNFSLGNSFLILAET